MYADRVEAEANRSIKDRLNGVSIGDTRRRQVAGKRFASSLPFCLFPKKIASRKISLGSCSLELLAIG